MPPVAIIRTGVANIASVIAGIKRAGADAVVTSDSGLVRDAEAVVLPGVGSFGAGMRQLRESNLDGAIKDRVTAGRPTLAVCLGLHLLCQSSEETSGVQGLGLIPAAVTRFPRGVAAPQFGWNRVAPAASSAFVRDGFAYFANSFKVAPEETPAMQNAGWSWSATDHGGRFASAIERGPVLACQFHPELSGPWGLGLLRRWLESAGAATQALNRPEAGVSQRVSQRVSEGASEGARSC
ncbi:MAG: imidazole glycerol phosphate synthase subunit HisH [Planctomycetota bacterium]